MLLEISGEITPERMKGWSQSKNNTQLWMGLVIEASFNAVKDNISLIVNVSLSEQIGSFSPIKKINLKSFPFSFFMYCLCEKYCKPITIQFRCCKEKYCIGTWNARFMNQGKLEVVKQEMARVNVDILGISELKWTGMREFISDTIISTTAGRNPSEEME